MNDHRQGIGERELQNLIDKTPLPLRRECIDSIRKVEATLELLGLTSHTWLGALDIYRKRESAATMADLAKSGIVVFHPVLNGYLRDLDHAFLRIKQFDPGEYQCKAIRTRALSDNGATGGRPQVVSDESVFQWLKDSDYQNSGNKKGLQIEAYEQLGVKKSRLLKIAKANGLTNSNRKKPPK